MPNQFDTFEEAEDLRVKCYTCGKHKLTIVGHYIEGQKPWYSLERCERDMCPFHCHGHKASVLVVEDSHDNREMVSFFQ